VPRDADGPVEEVDNVRARRCRLLGADVRTPPGAVPVEVVPPVLRRRLGEALEAGYDEPEQRPDAAAWAAGLAYSRRKLATCGACATHVHPAGLGRCPWCAMVAAGGRDPFPGGGRQ
jgi:DNA-binding helix-hairpin-helix protein with protein kinase domain